MQDAPLRPPAVAGQFYPAGPKDLARDLDRYLSPESADEPSFAQALACVVPHAGYMYSGHVAGAVYRRLPQRSAYVILGPNHFGRGAPLAVMSVGAWQTPLGKARLDTALVRELVRACPMLADDPTAHAREHSLEVQVPFLQRHSGDPLIAPIAVGIDDYAALTRLGQAVGEVVRQASKPVMLIASSDLNHYEPDSITRIKDRKAIERILALDPQGLYDTVHRERISMCGYGPTVAVLTAARELGAQQATLVKYATSADAGGDPGAVVGYAGIIIESSSGRSRPTS